MGFMEKIKLFGHLQWTQYLEGGLVVIFGILVVSTMISINKTTDAVAMYSFSQVIPDSNALSNALSNASLPATAVSALARQAIDPQCTVTYRKSASSTDTRVLSPVCECLYKVLGVFSDRAQRSQSDQASQAFTACFKTQAFVPINKYTFNVDSSDPSTDTTKNKFISRAGAAWIIIFSVIFHLVYNSIEFDKDHSYTNLCSNLMQRVLLFGCVIAQILLPLTASNGNPQTRNLVVFYIMLIIPAFVEGLFIDVYLSWLQNYKRRTAFIHPYVFQTTFLALVSIAVAENGVFEFHIFLSHYFTGHILTFAYTSVLLFLHYDCRKSGTDQNSLESLDYHTIYGYFLVVGATLLVVMLSVLPYYPMRDLPNLTWFMPWLFAGVVFAIPVFVEHMLDSADANGSNEDKLKKLAHLGFHAYLAIVVVVLLYLATRVWYLGYSDRILTYKQVPTDIMNFGLHTRTSNPLLYII